MITLFLAAVAAVPLAFAAAAADAVGGVTFTLDPILVAQLVLAAVLPLLVGLVTTRVTHAGTKGLILLALSLVSSLLAELIRAWQDGQTYDVGLGLLLALPTFLIGVGMHVGIYKPAGVSQNLQEVGTPHRE